MIRLLKDKVELYSSIKELTAERDHEFHKMSMRDAGIGSTMEDYNAHVSKLVAYLMNDKVEDALQEGKNMHNCYFYAINKINTKSLVFATLIKSINGKEYTGTTVEEHRDAILKLSKSGLKASEMEELLTEVKKKLMANLNPTFLIDTGTTEVLMPTLN